MTRSLINCTTRKRAATSSCPPLNFMETRRPLNFPTTRFRVSEVAEVKSSSFNWKPGRFFRSDDSGTRIPRSRQLRSNGNGKFSKSDIADFRVSKETRRRRLNPTTKSERVRGIGKSAVSLRNGWQSQQTGVTAKGIMHEPDIRRTSVCVHCAELFDWMVVYTYWRIWYGALPRPLPSSPLLPLSSFSFSFRFPPATLLCPMQRFA